MCFYNDDCYWSASSETKTVRTADEEIICRECRRRIPVGKPVHEIVQEENEIPGQCLNCQRGDCSCETDCEDGEKCQCDQPEMGETFETHRCDECDKFLQAVKAAEIESGCHDHESQPNYEQMIETISELDWDEAEKYFAKARAMFPELAQPEGASYLEWLEKKMFPRQDSA